MEIPPPPRSSAVVIPGTVVAIVGKVNAGVKAGTTGVVGIVMPVGNNPSKARVAKEPPPPPMVGVGTGVGVGTPPRRKAVVRVGKEGATTGATTVGNMGATTGAKAVGAASAGKTDKGKVILKVARGAGGIKVVTLNPKGVSAGAVAVRGGMALVGSKTAAFR